MIICGFLLGNLRVRKVRRTQWPGPYFLIKRKGRQMAPQSHQQPSSAPFCQSS